MMQVAIQPAIIGNAEQHKNLAQSPPAAPEDANRRRNLTAMYFYRFFSTLAERVGLGAVFEKFLFVLGSGNFPVRANLWVGLAQSMPGVASLCMDILAGCLVDARPERRARLVWASSLLALIGVLLHAAALLTEQQVVVLIMLFLWGVFQELATVSSEAIFADSIAEGQRLEPTVKKDMAKFFGAACSGLILFILGLARTAGWQTSDMKLTMAVGLVLMVPAMISLCNFRDPERNGNEQRAERFQDWRVPYLLAVSDWIKSFGAGMSAKFYGLWLIQDQRFSLMMIGILQMITPWVTVAVLFFTKKIANCFGRAQLSLALFGLAAAGLWLLAGTTWLPAVWVVYPLREAMTASCFALDRSILSDFTPTERRGCWNAATSIVTTMPWSGTAFLGGYLSDRWGYAYNMRVTAGIYVFACLVYSPLVMWVPRRQVEEAPVADEP